VNLSHHASSDWALIWVWACWCTWAWACWGHIRNFMLSYSTKSHFIPGEKKYFWSLTCKMEMSKKI